MFEVESTDQPPGTVVQVLQPGYTIAERLLRPALVAVAKGPPARLPVPTAGRSAPAAGAGWARPGERIDTTAKPRAAELASGCAPAAPICEREERDDREHRQGRSGVLRRARHSVILRWLQDRYRCEVVTFTADLGQGEELEPARAKAELMGATQIFVEDLREDARLRISDVPRQCAVRGRLSARHLDRPAADRQAAGRDRPRGRRRRRRPRRDRQGQRPGPLRAERLCPRSADQGDRPGANGISTRAAS